MQACNLIQLLKSLSLYVATVLCGFGVHSIVSLPLTLFVLSRLNPLVVMKCAHNLSHPVNTVARENVDSVSLHLVLVA